MEFSVAGYMEKRRSKVNPNGNSGLESENESCSKKVIVPDAPLTSMKGTF